jgi:GH25 family lysozyme M1 (1,4-beta-N-acetylmuramidase)
LNDTRWLTCRDFWRGSVEIVGTSRLCAVRTSARTLFIFVVALGALTSASWAAFAGGGIDVSRWQHGGTLNWSKVKAAGVDFAFIKATEGSTYTNPYFAGDWKSTTQLGIYRGAYHFARPSVGSAGKQARYFVNVAGQRSVKGDLPAVLDLEATGGLSVSKLQTWTGTWLRTVESLTGRAPIIYVSPSFWESHLGNSSAFHHYPLWVANYSVSSPRVPGGWPTWSFWQSSSSGNISGISGHVDINKFNGTNQQLAKMANIGGNVSNGGGTPTGPTAPSGPTTTTTTLTASSAKVAPGGSVTFSGKLATATGGVAALPVTLWRQYDGQTATKIASTTTGPKGGYSFAVTPDESASYYVKSSGSDSYLASQSPTVTVRMTGAVPTTMSMKASATELFASDHVTFSGTFSTASGGVPDRTVGLWQQVTGQPATKVLTTLTDQNGGYSFTLSPTQSASYYVLRGRTTFLARATSTAVPVSYQGAVPTSVTLTASQKGAYPGHNVTLSGTLKAAKGSVAKQTVAVARLAAGARNASTATKLTTDKRGRFSFSVQPSTTSTYVVTYSGGAVMAASSSTSVRVAAWKPKRTVVDLSASHARIKRATYLTIHGHLRTSAGTAVPGKYVKIYRRVMGTKAWVRVNKDLSSRTGFWSVVVRPASNSVYKAKYTGALRYQPAASKGFWLRVHR